MKAQMFIITIVFLVGLIFAVQNSLSQYTFLDISKTFSRNDLPIFLGVKDSLETIFARSDTCDDLRRNIQELKNQLNGKIIGGTALQVTTSFECPPKKLNATIQLRSLDIDSRETLLLG